jgi:hypothetical protein
MGLSGVRKGNLEFFVIFPLGGMEKFNSQV